MNDVKTKLIELIELTRKHIKEFSVTDRIARIAAGVIGFLMFLLVSTAGETLLFVMAFPTMLCIGLTIGFIVFELFRHFNLIESTKIESNNKDKET